MTFDVTIVLICMSVFLSLWALGHLIQALKGLLMTGSATIYKVTSDSENITIACNFFVWNSPEAKQRKLEGAFKLTDDRKNYCADMFMQEYEKQKNENKAEKDKLSAVK